MHRLFKTATSMMCWFIPLCNFAIQIYAADLCSNEVLPRTTDVYVQFPNENLDYLDFVLEQGTELGAIPEDYLNDQGAELIRDFAATLQLENVKGTHELKGRLTVKATNGSEYTLRSGTYFDYTLPDIRSEHQIGLPVGTKVIKKEGSDPPEYTLAQDVETEIAPPENFQVDIKIPAGQIVERIPGNGSTGTALDFQPKKATRDGYISLTVKKNGFDFREARFSVCLQRQGENALIFASEDVERTKVEMGEAVLKVRIPDIGESSPHLAKTVDLWVVARRENGDLAEAVSKDLRVSSRGTAIIWWIAAFLLAWVVAGTVAGKHYLNPIWFVAGKKGSASLSLAQILLWTMLTFSASAYVLSLSGTLLDLTGEVLTLLGIAGGASILAKVKSGQDDEGHALLDTPVNKPRWRDLFETEGRPDLLKLQMALFTALAAVFVVIEIYLNLEFPTLPAGLVTLMGISNGVYLGAKVSHKTNLQKLSETYKDLEKHRADLKKLESIARQTETDRKEAEAAMAEIKEALDAIENELIHEKDPVKRSKLSKERDFKKQRLDDAALGLDRSNQRKIQTAASAAPVRFKVQALHEKFEDLKRKIREAGADAATDNNTEQEQSA